MTLKKKVQLVLLFSLNLAVVGVTLYRVPHVIKNRGSQQYRSLLASVELLFATVASNALVLGSFVRDRGVKKMKFKYGSDATGSVEARSSSSRRPTLHKHWGSDEDLVRDIGIGVQPDLREMPDSPGIQNPHFTPAPLAKKLSDNMHEWQFPSRKRSKDEKSDDSLLPNDHLRTSRSNSTITPTRKVSFFDVGGLLDEGSSSSGPRRDSNLSGIDPLMPHDIVAPSPTASGAGGRRGSGSAALLQDLGGLLGPFHSKSVRSKSRTGTELQPIPQSSHESTPTWEPQTRPDPVLMDMGGLLK
jgi:hypothetical protein